MTTTETHPFYVPAKGWTETAKLRAGDILVTVNGEYAVLEQVSHEITESPVRVYNFEVEGLHTYYVGADESDPGSFVLVHNKCVAKEGSYSAKVKAGGDPNHYVGHAHIYYGTEDMASISETGEILAGKLDHGARMFVSKHLTQIAEGIRKFYYLK